MLLSTALAKGAHCVMQSEPLHEQCPEHAARLMSGCAMLCFATYPGVCIDAVSAGAVQSVTDQLCEEVRGF